MSALQTTLSRIDYWCLEQNRALALKITAAAEGSLEARVWAAAITPMCALTLALKVTVDVAMFASMAGRSITHLRFEMGNIQLGAVMLFEQVRNLAGTIVGTAIGVFNPKRASSAFLVRDASLLPRVLTPEVAARLYVITDRVMRFCETNDLELRPVAGSYLGLFRHKGVIAWDDDVDFMLHPDGTERMRQLIDDGVFKEETGLTALWADENGGWRFYFDEGEECAAILNGTKFPFMDLFATKLNAHNQRIEYSSILARSWAPQEYFTQEEWNDTREYPFGPLSVKAPKNPLPFFKRAFGESAMKWAYVMYHHKDFKIRALPQRVLAGEMGPVAYDKELYETLSLVQSAR